MSKYLEELTEAMAWLGRQPDTLFLGQQVVYPGTAIFGTMYGVPEDKRVEFPVAENLQVGVSIGLSLEGFVPVSIFPRWNFLLCAADQLVNHLDRLPLYSDYRPRVIIRTSVGRSTPLDPGPQHQDDFGDAFRRMCHTIRIRGPECPLLETYKMAYRDSAPTIVVEDGNRY